MNESNDNLKDQTLKIALASFMHDIGKFAQRAQGNTPGEAAFYPSKEFINSNSERLLPKNFKTQLYTHKHAIYTAAFIDHLEKILPECFHRVNWGGSVWVGDLAAGHHLLERDDGTDKSEAGQKRSRQNFERSLIVIADRLASALDRKGAEKFESEYNRNQEIANYKSARLWPIIEAINITTESKVLAEEGFKYRIPLRDLKEDNFFPVSKDEAVPASNSEGAKEYRQLFNKFVDELKGLAQFSDNVELWFEQFENLYMRYAGQIPAATVSPAMQDISLYDHSRVAAAIATALFRYHTAKGLTRVEDVENATEKKLLFIGTDFFGIQKFIFASGGATNKAAAKLLRGRSFYVSLLSETIAAMLLKETGLPVTSILFNAAGQVTILAPNLPEIKEAVRKVREEANKWLIDQFYGQTSLGIATVEVSQNTVGFDYRQMWHMLSRAIEKQKFEKFDIAELGGVQHQFFEEFNPDLGICAFCGQRPAQGTQDYDDDKKAICYICSDQLELGAKLVKANAMAIWESSSQAFDEKMKAPLFGRYHVWLGSLGKAVSKGVKGELLALARLTNAESEPEWRKVAYRPLKGYVPIYTEADCEAQPLPGEPKVIPGTIKSFETIAQSARIQEQEGDELSGIAALGVLKADVDNLGMIFGMGLNKEVQTLTRISVLSRQFNNFFALYLPTLLEKSFPNVYTVFAGGDDLFLIGPWTEVFELAPVIRSKFGKFVCNNSDVTISLGISIHKPGEPVASMSEAAEEALEKAKAVKDKNSVCVFGEVVTWGRLNKLNEIAAEIRGWINKKYVNTSMLYKLNASIDDIIKSKKLLKSKKVSFTQLADSLGWKARLKYSFARMDEIGGMALKSGDVDLVRAELEQSVEWLEEYKTSMRIPLWQEIYRRRKR